MAIDTEDKRRIASAQGLIWIIGPVPDGSISVYNDRRHIAGMYPYAIGTNLFEAGVPGIGLNGTAAGNRVTLSAGAANATYGINDLSGAGSSNYLNFDFWFDPNTVTLNNATVYIYEVANDSGNDFVQVRLRYSGGYEVSVWAWGSGQTYEQVGSWQSVTDAEHHIEVFVQKAAATGSGSGQVEWTLDDVSIAAKTNCDPFDFLWDESRLGITGNEEANYTGAYYLDELTITFTQPAIPDTGADTPVTTLTIPVGGIRMLRLLRGDDPRYPRAYLNLSGLSGDIFMMEGGFSPGTGEYTEIWSGRSHRFDGEKLLSRSKDNSEFDLKYGLEGSSKNELFALQVDINRFFEDAALFQIKYIGERIWVEYRWNDGLDVEAPLWGDFNHYMEIITAKVPKWSDDLHTSALIAGFIEGTVAQFTCVPYAEGLRRKAMHGYGNVSMDKNGIALGTQTAQGFTNAGFMDPTDWDIGWTASAGLGVVQSKKPGFFRVGGSAAYLVNTTGVAASFYQSATLIGGGGYVLSFEVKRADGSAVSSTDVELMVAGSLATTTFIEIDDNWYTAYAKFAGVGSSQTYGIQVKAGKAVYIDNARLLYNVRTDFPIPIIHPGLQSIAMDQASQLPGGVLRDDDFGEILSGNFTLTAWVTPYFTTPYTIAVNYDIFRYYYDSNNYFTVKINAQSETIIIDKGIVGVNYGQTFALSYTYNTPLHLVITQDNDTVSIYADASLLGTFNAPGWVLSGGIFEVGTNSGIHPNCAFDGLRVFGEVFTNAQITLLYNSELVVKQAGKLVGTPPVLHVPSAFTSAAVTQETNGLYLIGIGGDAPAKVDWDIQSEDPSYSPKFHEFWLGIHATLEPVLPSVAYIGDFSGNVNTAYFGDAYGSVTITGSSVVDLYVEIDYPKLLRGKFRMLFTIRWLGATAGTLKSFYHHGLNYFRFGDEYSMPQNSAPVLYDLGIINIGYQTGYVPSYVRVGARASNLGASAQIYYDYFFLMPGENTAKIISGVTDSDITWGSGATLRIDGKEAVIYHDDGYILQPLSNELAEVVAYPDKYNLVMFLMADDGAQANFIPDQITITPYVTIRHKLAGGPIA